MSACATTLPCFELPSRTIKANIFPNNDLVLACLTHGAGAAVGACVPDVAPTEFRICAGLWRMRIDPDAR